MSVTEQQRLHLFKTLEQRLGDEDAVTLMAMPPPPGSVGISTKEDLVLLRSDLRAEISGLRVEVADVKSELRSEMAGLKADVADLKSGLKGDMAAMGNRFVGRFVGAMAMRTAVMGVLLSSTH